jgi:hypothetical protein
MAPSYIALVEIWSPVASVARREQMSTLAQAFRAQAEVLKRKRKKKK